MRRCFRVLKMVSALHGKGFHGLRIYTHIYPLAYRIELFPSMFVDETGVRYRENALATLEDRRLLARHSGADENAYFGWPDARDADAEQLALQFIQRFPELTEAVCLTDHAYVGWYATLMARCAYGFLPYMFAEFEPFDGSLRMHQCGCYESRRFPLPPAVTGDHVSMMDQNDR